MLETQQKCQLIREPSRKINTDGTAYDAETSDFSKAKRLFIQT